MRKKLPAIDIGANLLDPMFQGVYRDKRLHESDLVRVLRRARNVGVERVICTCGTVSDATAGLEFARAERRREARDSPSIFSTVGIHPTNATQALRENPTWKEELMRIGAQGKAEGIVVAVGECGLDRARESFSPFEDQIKIWECHFDLCKALTLPMFIHSRECGEDTFATLMKYGDHLPAGCVVHSFDGTVEEAMRLISHFPDLYIGLNGCSLRTPENLDVVRALPLDRILVETDAPWCEIKRTHAGFPYLSSSSSSGTAPALASHDVGEEFLELDAKDFKKMMKNGGDTTSSMREFVVKNRNEPKNLISVLEIVARARDKEPLEEVARTIRENTMKLFFPRESHE